MEKRGSRRRRFLVELQVKMKNDEYEKSELKKRKERVRRGSLE